MKKLYLFLLPVAAVLGPYALPINTPAGNLFFFRLLVLLGFAFLFVGNARGHWHKDGFKALTVLFIAFWLAYGLVSLLWTPDPLNGMQGDLSVLLWLLLVVSLFTMQVAEKSEDTPIYAGWVAAYVLCIAFAVWEWNTGHHFPGYYTSNMPAYKLRHIAMGTLGNPNNFAATIVLCWPFVFLFGFGGEVGAWSRMGRGLVVVSAPVLILMAEGRLAFIAFAIQICVWAVMNVRRPRRAAVTTLAVVALVGASVVWLRHDERMLTKLLVLYEYGFTGPQSAHYRLNTVLNGLTMLFNSAGFGIGAGGYAAVMSHGVHYWTNGNPDPHNFWMEIASEYGLVIFAGFVTLYIAMFRRGYRNRKWAAKYHQERSMRISEMALLIMVGYFFVSAENSSYMNQSVNWMILATLVMMTVRDRPGVHEEATGEEALEGARGRPSNNS